MNQEKREGYVDGLKAAQDYAAHLLDCPGVPETLRKSSGWVACVHEMLTFVDKQLSKIAAYADEPNDKD